MIHKNHKKYTQKYNDTSWVWFQLICVNLRGVNLKRTFLIWYAVLKKKYLEKHLLLTLINIYLFTLYITHFYKIVIVLYLNNTRFICIIKLQKQTIIIFVSVWLY